MNKISFRQILLSIIILYMLSACQSKNVEYENVESESEGYLSFNTNTVLQNLSEDHLDIFTPLKTTPEPNWYKDSASPVRWSQEDYYRIAKAVNKFIWNDSFEEWNLKHILFKLDCANAVNGPQDGIFDLFRIDQGKNPPARLEKSIEISPLIEEVYWYEYIYTPSLYEFQNLDLSTMNYPVEKALQIAENAGGRNARLSVENNCDIFLDLYKSDNLLWSVGYSKLSKQSFSQRIYSITIDAYSGLYHLDESK